MSPEERLNRLERIAKLFVREGLRERRNRNELDQKINIIVNYQIGYEERFARADKQFEALANAQKLTEKELKELAAAQKELAAAQKELAASQKELAAAQKQTDEKLGSLIDIVRRDRNGNANTPDREL
jgi:hypothetical protein